MRENEVYRYRGIEYTLTREDEGSFWRWFVSIEGKNFVGTTLARTQRLATQHVTSYIDDVLRSAPGL